MEKETKEFEAYLTELIGEFVAKHGINEFRIELHGKNLAGQEVFEYVKFVNLDEVKSPSNP